MRQHMACGVGERNQLPVTPYNSLVLHGEDHNRRHLPSVGTWPVYPGIVARLVALALPGGPNYPAAIQRVWEAGDAIAPLDPRLPEDEARRVLAALQPGAIMEADGEIRALDGGRPVEAGDAVVIATSGTAGHAKGVIHTHASIEASARATSTALSVDPRSDRWVACLPLAHIGGLAVVLRSIVTGTPVEVHDGFDATAVKAAASTGATLVSLVTRALNQIPAQLFRTILIGGAAPPPDRPKNVIATYGMTETGSGVVYEDVLLDRLEVRIIPTDTTLLDADPAAGGEIHLRGPMLFRGYRSGANPFLEDGWFPTGDLGSWSERGNLIVEGRRGDVIVTGGEKVWPEPVERALVERADIAQAAVIGQPDKDWGHRVVAVLVVEPGHQPPDLDDIRDHISQRLPVWSAPKEIRFADDLPRTSLGKIRRNLL